MGREQRRQLECLALDAALRTSFPAFLHKVFHTLCPGQTFERGWPIEAMTHQLGRVLSGEERRLIVNLPPRSLKSITFSVALPAYALGHNPQLRIVCVSYSSELARKLSNDFRAVVESDWYRRVFPHTHIGRFKNTETEIEFTERGYRLAVSVHGTLTGRGGDLIIIDDPINLWTPSPKRRGPPSISGSSTPSSAVKTTSSLPRSCWSCSAFMSTT
jgi:hypothetical protein